jgi:hypothetical protein
MREVAKSLVGFSWAVSVFGAQQVARLMTPSSGAPVDRAAAEIDEVTKAVVSHMNDRMAQQFRAGDDWQRRTIDALFDAARLESLDPRHLAESLDPRQVVTALDPRPMMRAGADLVQRSVETIRQSVQPAPHPDVPPVL